MHIYIYTYYIICVCTYRDIQKYAYVRDIYTYFMDIDIGSKRSNCWVSISGSESGAPFLSALFSGT